MQQSERSTPEKFTQFHHVFNSTGARRQSVNVFSSEKSGRICDIIFVISSLLCIVLCKKNCLKMNKKHDSMSKTAIFS